MRLAVFLRVVPSRLRRRVWPPGLLVGCVVAAGCSTTPLLAEPQHGASTASDPAPITTHGVPRDPLDVLRERLADKLNVHTTKEAGGADALRVTSAASSAAAGESGAQRSKGGVSTPASSRMAARQAPPGRKPVEPLTLASAARAGALLPRGSSVAGQAPLATLPVAWSYGGDAGPQAWSRLKPEFATCGTGTRQSPIDIRDGIKVQLDTVQFDYRPSRFSVVDNGHTVQVNVGPGNSIQVMGRRYDLIHFDFHRPSEVRVNGQVFDMAAHLVHRDVDGHLAVVAVLLDRGSAHPLVQAVWNNLPLEKGDEVPARQPLDLSALLPTDRSYYTYMGSLTTPPCSEGVLWMVMKNPVTISDEQLAIFARLYPMNARPIQAASGRLIKESN